MNLYIACLMTALSAAPQIDDSQTIYPSTSVFEAAIRGQNPTYDEEPAATQAPVYTEVPAATPYGGYGPYQQPIAQDPFLGQQPGGNPYGRPGPYGSTFGANGPQPYRMGWTVSGNTGYLPKESLKGGTGKLGIFEFNTDFKYTSMTPMGWIFTANHEFGYRAWDGPSSVGLPGSVYRLGWDLQLATPAHGPFSYSFGFNPSLNSDFDSTPTGDAWNWDGRGMMFYRHSPFLTFVGGAGYWDRVNDRIIPYAGVIYTPDDRWEFRILFPESQISYFLGNAYGVGHWLYVSGEYRVEAYQIREGLTGTREKVQLEDWRILFGIRGDSGPVAGFVEAGWVFAREVDFLNGTAGFDVSTGFILRTGMRF